MTRTKTSRPSKRSSELPDLLPTVPSLQSLDEISDWLGTFRERLRIAHAKDQPKLEAALRELEVHYRRRRAELS